MIQWRVSVFYSDEPFQTDENLLLKEDAAAHGE
jgi:hypothetical protein